MQDRESPTTIERDISDRHQKVDSPDRAGGGWGWRFPMPGWLAVIMLLSSAYWFVSGAREAFAQLGLPDLVSRDDSILEIRRLWVRGALWAVFVAVLGNGFARKIGIGMLALTLGSLLLMEIWKF